MSKLLFIGDIVGEVGVAYLEQRLPQLIRDHQPDFIIANAENSAMTTHPRSPGNCGMTPDLNARLFALGIDLLTGGNHSWDGPYGHSIHDDPRVIRPLNYGTAAPGRGAAIIEKSAGRLGVLNLMSRTAMQSVDMPYDVFERQMADWQGRVDWVIVDFHGESVTEKQVFAHAVADRVIAVLGTHTHVATLDTQIIAGTTAYVSDVGMTGPTGGIQGYAPEMFVEYLRLRLPGQAPFTFATGEVELGAVLITLEQSRAVHIERLR